MTTTALPTAEEKTHLFTLANMGSAPFVFVGMYSLPSPSLAEANPEAYNNALREMPRFKNGCGSCAYCFTPIVHHCIIKNAEGEIYAVGCDCVEKTGDKGITTAVKEAQKKAAAEKREAARVARHAAWLVANKPRLDAEQAAREEAARKIEEAKATNETKFATILRALDNAATSFHNDLAAQLRRNGSLSERQAFFALKCLFGGRQTKKNAAEWEAMAELVCPLPKE